MPLQRASRDIASRAVRLRSGLCLHAGPPAAKRKAWAFRVCHIYLAPGPLHVAGRACAFRCHVVSMASLFDGLRLRENARKAFRTSATRASSSSGRRSPPPFRRSPLRENLPSCRCAVPAGWISPACIGGRLMPRLFSLRVKAGRSLARSARARSAGGLS